jgi:hypothetical protein
MSNRVLERRRRGLATRYDKLALTLPGWRDPLCGLHLTQIPHETGDTS